MERFWLAVLIGCAVIGASLTDPEAENPSNLAQGSAHSLPEPPSVSAGPPDAAVAGPNLAVEPGDQEIVAQILQRFAVRHTALPERERRRLAHAIVIEARALRLEPDLVMAVIEVESAGYHLAQSHVGALGLMQLLPSTGEELAGKLGIEWMGPDTLFDPIINIRLGTAYLRQLADRYDGNVEIALAAYNGGPGRIDRRLRRGATVPSLYIEQVKRAVNRYADIGTTRS
jgi:soluble lytic murein transglycosylase-like protein